MQKQRSLLLCFFLSALIIAENHPAFDLHLATCFGGVGEAAEICLLAQVTKRRRLTAYTNGGGTSLCIVNSQLQCLLLVFRRVGQGVYGCTDTVNAKSDKLFCQGGYLRNSL